MPDPIPASTPAPAAPASPVALPDIIDPSAYSQLVRAGLKVHTRENHALNLMGNVDIMQTTPSSPGGARVLAVVRFPKITPEIIAEVQPLLATARAKLAPAS